MKLEDLFESNVNNEATRIVMNGLKAVSMHTDTSAYEPFHKHVRVSNKQHPNLVTVHFPVERRPSGRVTHGGPIERHYEGQMSRANVIAQELEDEMKGTVKLEDSSITEHPNGVSLFMVSDDFVG